MKKQNNTYCNPFCESMYKLIEKSGRSANQINEICGFSNGYIYKCLHGQAVPSIAATEDIASASGASGKEKQILLYLRKSDNEVTAITAFMLKLLRETISLMFWFAKNGHTVQLQKLSIGIDIIFDTFNKYLPEDYYKTIFEEEYVLIEKFFTEIKDITIYTEITNLIKEKNNYG